MMRKSALLIGALFSTVSASSVLAQSPAATKPAPAYDSTRHMPAKPMPDTTKVSSAARSGATHAVWTREQVKEAQQGLAKAGYLKGRADGVYGKRTRNAIRKYQKANKLPVTGRLDQDLLTKLHSA
jgi:peptidoglycan hydrolase-like protein with peptidoglycan-binding domain